MEQSTEKLIKDTKAFSDGVIGVCFRWSLAVDVGALYIHTLAMFTSASGFAQHFSVVFHPLAGEYDVLGKYPDATKTVQSVDKLESAAEDLRTSIGPELELIESRIMGPAKEFQTILRAIRKSITKREHKVWSMTERNSTPVTDGLVARRLWQI